MAGGASSSHHVMIDNLNDEVILEDAEDCKEATMADTGR